MRWLEVDSPLFSAILAKLWQAFSGPITVIFVLNFLSTGEQGVYYAMVSVVSIQGLFELGLLTLLISQVGRYSGGLFEPVRAFTRIFQTPEFELSSALPPVEIVQRLQTLNAIISGARKWFRFASIAFIAGSLVIGYRGFSEVDSAIPWQLPLFSLIISSACIVLFSPTIAILEGLGLRDYIYRLRLVQMMVATAFVWLTLVLGGGVWSLVVASLIQAAFSGWMVWTHRGVESVLVQHEKHLQSLLNPTTNASMNLTRARKSIWVRDVLPGQWRVALLSIVQTLSTQVSTLIVLSYHGERAAAPLGLAISITSPIQMLALAWLQTKLSVVAAFQGRGEREVAGTLWRRSGVISTAILGFLLILVTLATQCLFLVNPEWGSRFLSVKQMSLFSIGIVANHLVAVQAFYIMTRFSRPIFLPAIIGLSAIAILVWTGGIQYSVNGVILGYSIGMVGVLFPLHTFSYAKHRKQQ